MASTTAKPAVLAIADACTCSINEIPDGDSADIMADVPEYKILHNGTGPCESMTLMQDSGVLWRENSNHTCCPVHPYAIQKETKLRMGSPSIT